MFSHSTRSLFLIAFGHLSIELCNNFLPVLYPVFMDSMGLNYSHVGVIAFVAGTGTSLAQPIFGYLSDRWNAQLIIVLSITWSGVIMALVGFTWDYLSLVILVGLGSLGSAAFHPSGAAIASSGGTARRGTAVSVFSVGGNLGTALSPLWVTAGMGWLGIRGTVILIPVALATSLLLRQQMEQVPHAKENHTVARQKAARKGPMVGLVIIIVAMMFRAWFQVSLMTYLPTWVQTQGGSLAAGGHTLFTFLTSVGVGSLIGGALSDRVGHWRVLALSLILLGPAEWIFLSISGSFQIVLLCAMGVLLGATFPSSIVMAQEIWPGGLGLASGLVMGIPWVGGGIGASLTGLVADRFSLRMGLQSLALPAVLGAAGILAYAALQKTRDRM